MKYLIHTTLAALFFCVSTLTLAQGQTHFTHLYVFGDSLSDIGNNTGAPYTNHASNSIPQIWVNRINAALFGDKPIYPSSKLPTGHDSINDISVDFAWGGAISGGTTSSGTPTALDQINTFLTQTNQKPDPNALYIIWIGGNDLLAMFPSNDPKNVKHSEILAHKENALTTAPQSINDQSPVASMHPLNQPVQHIADGVGRLHNAGIPYSHIYVVNLPDLSDTPRAQESTHGNALQLKEIRILSELFDLNLSVHLTPDLPVSHIIDVFQLLSAVVKDPGQYNITTIKHSCSGDGKLPDCAGYMFFDGVHPTAHTHQIIADYITKSIENG